MNYLYQRVPPEMVGDTLMPLNRLKTVSPKIYDRCMAKYSWRPHVPKQRILPLDCLWNDVIFLTAVSPSHLDATLKECGTVPVKKRFFKIDPHLLDRALTTVWLCKRGRAKEMEDFASFDPDGLDPYAKIGDETRAYYRSMIAAGKRQEMLIYAYVPHILFKGTIDVRKAEIVEI